MTRYVGVDLHRRRSVIVVLDADGTELWTHRIYNDLLGLGLEIEKAGPAPEVVLEATWGWYWAADVITELIASGQHPKRIAERLGHTSVRTVLDVYGHLLEGLDTAAADALDRLYRQAFAASARPATSSQVVDIESHRLK